MPINTIVRYLKRKEDEKKSKRRREEEARRIFLSRLRSAFPEPLRYKKNHQEEWVVESRRCFAIRQQSREMLSRELTKLHVSTEALYRLAEEATLGDSRFVRRWVAIFSKNGQKTLHDVKRDTPLGSLLFVIRGLYADGIAEDLPLEVVVPEVVHLFLRSSKGAR